MPRLLFVVGRFQYSPEQSCLDRIQGFSVRSLLHPQAHLVIIGILGHAWDYVVIVGLTGLAVLAPASPRFHRNPQPIPKRSSSLNSIKSPWAQRIIHPPCPRVGPPDLVHSLCCSVVDSIELPERVRRYFGWKLGIGSLFNFRSCRTCLDDRCRFGHIAAGPSNRRFADLHPGFYGW